MEQTAFECAGLFFIKNIQTKDKWPFVRDPVSVVLCTGQAAERDNLQISSSP